MPLWSLLATVEFKVYQEFLEKFTMLMMILSTGKIKL